MNKTYLFYDTETTGLSKCFDQVLQFAAIRTDMDLNEIFRHEILVKLNPDVIPSPKAVLTTQIGITEMRNGQPEVEAMQEIHKLLNVPGTISVGYNSLDYDDKLLRFSFHKNLLPPYTHQYKNQCGRMDILPITVLYYLVKKDILDWPVVDEKISFKLENICKLNNLMSGQAHNAMVDVEATLELAKKLKTEDKMWNYVCDSFQKEIDKGRIQKIITAHNEKNKNIFCEALLVGNKIGHKDNFITPVLHLGTNNKDKNKTLWLRLDQENLLNLNENNIDNLAWVIGKKFGEKEILLPMEPRFLTYISQERKTIYETNKKFLFLNEEILEKLASFHQNYEYETIENVDIDAALYQMPFPSPFEEKLFRDFHAAEPRDKLSVANTFPNVKRKEQAIRILARNYQEVLPEKERQEFNQYLLSKCYDYVEEEKLSPKTALEKLQELKNRPLDKKEERLVEEMEKFFSYRQTENDCFSMTL